MRGTSAASPRSMRATAKTSANESHPTSEPDLRVVKPRKRRPATARVKGAPESSSAGSLKPLLIGVGVGSAVVLLATAVQAQARQGARQSVKGRPTLWSALAKTAALALARVVAKRVGRELAKRALPALAGRAIVALSSHAARS